jgi:hypothetical protein
MNVRARVWMTKKKKSNGHLAPIIIACIENELDEEIQKRASGC